MNFMYYLLMFINSQKIIKNIHLPSCKNCIHYKPSLLHEFTSPFSKCENFGVKDIITDEITYDYADSCRADETRCGKDGTYFQPEKKRNMKILKHKILNNSPLIVFFISIVYQIIKNAFL